MIRTDRLILRQWTKEDFAPFAELNADPEVMEFFPSTQTRHESDFWAAQNKAEIEDQGWGLWAVEVRATGEFAGFTGLWQVGFEAHFTPAVEVGWRLARRYWGQGFATEAARASVAFGFGELALHEIVSMTAVTNLRSRRVMEKLGFTYDPADDFDHPRLAADEPLRRHVLYRLSRAAYEESGYSPTVS